jgi:hypothetical protein
MSEQDIVERLRAEVVPCPGRGLDGHGMRHCAECCFGSGIEATSEADLRIMLLARDAADQIERLRAAGDALVQLIYLNPNTPSQEDWDAAVAAWREASRER